MRMLLLAVLFMFGLSAQAQTYPTRTVRIVVPATPAGRLFRDELGRLNQALAAESEEAELVVAGRVLSLGD